MATRARQTGFLIPTVLGAGTAQVCAQAGVASTNYFLLQKAYIGFQSGGGSAGVYALTDGSAAGGTIGVFSVPPNGAATLDFTGGAQRYDGIPILATAGLFIKPTTDLANHGTISGTVSCTVRIRDVLQ